MSLLVMAGLDPTIHVLVASILERKTWLPGTSPGMTEIAAENSTALTSVIIQP